MQCHNKETGISKTEEMLELEGTKTSQVYLVFAALEPTFSLVQMNPESKAPCFVFYYCQLIHSH